jgi:hypothetical protein
MRCDCGYDFGSRRILESFADPASANSALERSQKNLPTILVRTIVFLSVYMGLNFAMYFAFGYKPGGLLIGLAFGLAGAAAGVVKIRVKKRF